MEFPFGHHPHSHVRAHNHRREEDDDDDGYQRNYPPPGTILDSAYPPPPSFYGRDEQPPPPPFSTFPPRRPVVDSYEYPSDPPPPPISAHSNYDHAPYGTNPDYRRPTDDYVTTGSHVSHDSGESESHHGHHPHLPSFLQHHTHESAPTLSNKPTYKIITKANSDYSLTIRNGHVILAQSDPTNEAQHWYKDEKYSTRVKDEEGFPCFALVNKATGQAMKHSIGATHPVQLVAYNSEVLDESVLWTQGKDLGDGFRAVRMINNIRLMVDAYHGDKKSGGIHDGTPIYLWQWNKGDNQKWKIVPYCKFLD